MIKNGILHTEFFYKDGRIIDKGIEYYPNKKSGIGRLSFKSAIESTV